MKISNMSLTKKESELLTQLNAEKLPVETLAYAAWSRIVEPGDAVAVRLVDTFGAVTALNFLIAEKSFVQVWEEASEKTPDLDVTQEDIKKGFLRWTPRLESKATFEDVTAALQKGLRAVFPKTLEWPEKLNDLGANRPVMLWCHGDTSLLSEKSAAVVGARAATAYGEQVTNEMVTHLSRRQITTVSGGAYGIDAVAHRAALSAEGKTVAILAGGTDRWYPAGNQQLFKRISENGLICSEMVPGSAPTRWRFLQRNRLIAALSEATLITEAGIRSGSLNTAGHAAQLGREIGAVPGPITSVTSLGTHRLLKEYNAHLIASLDDLDEMLGIETIAGIFLEADDRESSLHRRVIDAVPLHGLKSTFQIAQSAGIAVKDSHNLLTELEVLGAVKKVSRGELEKDEWGMAV